MSKSSDADRGEGRAGRLEINGPLTSDTAAEVRRRARLTAVAGDVVIDLRHLSALDQAGVGVLLGAVRQVREAGGSVRIEVCWSWLAALSRAGVNRLVDMAVISAEDGLLAPQPG